MLTKIKVDEKLNNFLDTRALLVCSLKQQIVGLILVLDMKYRCLVIFAYLFQVVIAGKGIINEKNQYCSYSMRKDIPIVYLTLNPISTVSWMGTITQRQLVLNWKWPSTSDEEDHMNKNESKNDWIGLFNISLSNGLNLEGTFCRIIFVKSI